MPFPFCAAAGELELTADRPAQKETEHYSYPKRILRALFPYPEPSFAYNAGESNNRSAIDADELDSVHQALERRSG
jgi:hypothetical protein